MYSKVGCWHLRGKDWASNHFGRTQVSLSLSFSMYVCVCVRTRACTHTHTHTHIYIWRKTCVLPKVFEPESFQLKYNPPTFEYKIHSLKLIYSISSIYKPKIECFGYCLPLHQAAQNGQPKVVCWLDLHLLTYKFSIRPFNYDLNILKPLQTNFFRFQMLYTIKLTNY